MQMLMLLTVLEVKSFITEPAVLCLLPASMNLQQACKWGKILDHDNNKISCLHLLSLITVIGNTN